MEIITFMHCWWENKMAYSLRKYFHCFKKLNIDLLYNLAILLSIYSREMKTYSYKDLSTNVHSRKFYSSQKVKQFKCPSIDEWINKICYIHIMYFYWTIKKWTADTFHNGDEPQLPFMLSERSQIENSNMCFVNIFF